MPVTVKGGPETAEVKSLPKHKKNPEVGEKQTVYSSQIFVEQEDAVSFEDNEEVTLMDWGNAIVRSKTVDASGVITGLELELHLAGDFRKTKKKVTWLAQPTPVAPLVDVTLLDYDYLITKKKLEEADAVKDFVTPVTEFRELARADANVRSLVKSDIIQFERKGYYIFDGVSKEDGRLEFIRIPDGRAASIASKAAPQTGAATPVPKGAATPAQTQEAGADGQRGQLSALETPVDTKMYKVDVVYGEGEVPTPADTKMYKVQSVYGVKPESA